MKLFGYQKIHRCINSPFNMYLCFLLIRSFFLLSLMMASFKEEWEVLKFPGREPPAPLLLETLALRAKDQADTVLQVIWVMMISDLLTIPIRPP